MKKPQYIKDPRLYSRFGSPDGTPVRCSSPKSMRLNAIEEQERNQYIEEKYNAIFDQEMKKTKQMLIQNLGPH